MPDVATVVADYDEGCQVLISATMCNDVQLGEVIRGHTATIMFDGHAARGLPWSSSRSSRDARPSGRQHGRRAATSSTPSSPARTPTPSGSTSSSASARATPRPSARPSSATPRSPRSTWACKSYREGKAYYFDKETGEVSDADTAWADRWEEREQAPRQAQPGHRLEGRRRGLAAHLPDYQKLEGDWVDGKDPVDIGLSELPSHDEARVKPREGSGRLAAARPFRFSS